MYVIKLMRFFARAKIDSDYLLHYTKVTDSFSALSDLYFPNNSTFDNSNSFKSAISEL